MPRLLAGMVVASALGAAAHGAGPDACRLTTRQAIDSCRLAARSDRIVGLGKCTNAADAAAGKACRHQVSADAHDALGTCGNERKVRETACRKLGPAAYHPAIDPA